MLRSVLLAATVMLSLPGCHREPKPITAAQADLPPLPPASGTHVGYLIDNTGALEFTTAQLDELKRIDRSLAASNDSIDTQLREIEKPEEQPPPGKGEPPAKVNMAPGAMPMTSTRDASKLHTARAENNEEALVRAFALLTPVQQDKARELLSARGIKAPPPTTTAAPTTTAPVEPSAP